jgi:DNA-binding response OmpR family regulator
MVTTSITNTKQHKVRILLIDDEEDVATTLKIILEEEEKFQVDVFNDSKLALSNFKAGKYDLLLLDIMMPKMNGFELCQQLQNIDDKVKVQLHMRYIIGL